MAEKPLRTAATPPAGPAGGASPGPGTSAASSLGPAAPSPGGDAARPAAAPLVAAARSQLLAALATLEDCLERCPAGAWQESQGDAPFSQVLFHALFYLDYYLGEEDGEFRLQAFHRERAAIFADYEELEDRIPVRLYEWDFCRSYAAHCRRKAEELFAGLRDADCLEPSRFERRRAYTRLELFVYMTRHTQHHAAQLGLRLQLLSSVPKLVELRAPRGRAGLTAGAPARQAAVLLPQRRSGQREGPGRGPPLVKGP